MLNPIGRLQFGHQTASQVQVVDAFTTRLIALPGQAAVLAVEAVLQARARVVQPNSPSLGVIPIRLGQPCYIDDCQVKGRCHPVLVGQIALHVIGQANDSRPGRSVLHISQYVVRVDVCVVPNLSAATHLHPLEVVERVVGVVGVPYIGEVVLVRRSSPSYTIDLVWRPVPM